MEVGLDHVAHSQRYSLSVTIWSGVEFGRSACYLILICKGQKLIAALSSVGKLDAPFPYAVRTMMLVRYPLPTSKQAGFVLCGVWRRQSGASSPRDAILYGEVAHTSMELVETQG